MLNPVYPYIPLVAAYTLLAFAYLVTSKSAKGNSNLGSTATMVGLLGIISSVSSLIIVLNVGTIHTPLLGIDGLGFSLRLDTLSTSMLTMIAILGFTILKFSNHYMDGDPRKGVFFRRLAITIASVQLLVLSGNIFQLFTFWVITSICLHYLLKFYKDRPQAISAARKKFIVARVGDLSLLIAGLLIYLEIGSGELAEIFEGIQAVSALTTPLVAATVLLVIAAILKSAQFPTHGWLIEVVETPTPVSALLHAGLLNAGPFLMVRMGFLMIESTTASILLIVIGGFTALFASVVYMTQSSVKTALGYSSVAHMGFSLLICGFGVHTAAILHVVAHSFYKAHAFLSSGSVIDLVRARRIAAPKRNGSFVRITFGIAFALGIYTLACFLWGVNPNEDFGLMVTGAIIVMGISQVFVALTDTKSTINTLLASAGIASFVAASFFTLEHGASVLLSDQLPLYFEPGIAVRTAAVIVIGTYATVVFLQLIAPTMNRSSLGYRLGVHIRNGLYVNVIFDRMIGSLKNEKFKWVNLKIQEDQDHLKDYSQEEYSEANAATN
ncbi:MAG: proton-conducting transporter membrane subunit [Cytophagales bacterium]|nr:proton-conducting transporter membrane subunit [Cytophagales bacterium]